MELNEADMSRYSRHLTLPQVGEEGQKKLKAASVLFVGTGGLGSPALMYLAAAGVGRIGIIDPDVVDESNLQRQVLHGQSFIGEPKVVSAVNRIKEINPLISVEVHQTRFSTQNAWEIAHSYQIIIDGSDNFETRYLTNDVGAFLKIPVIYGSIFQFSGQWSVFAPHLGGPCYRCMLPIPPDPEAAPTWEEAGVLGVLPGIIGSMQAMEAVKLILGIGEPAIGKLFHYDTLTNQQREFKLKPDPKCPVCGDNPTLDTLEAIKEEHSPKITMKEITVTELKSRLDAGTVEFFLDVRTPGEYEAANLGGVLIPLQEIAERYEEVPRDKEIIIHCKAGVRSARVCYFLMEQGY